MLAEFVCMREAPGSVGRALRGCRANATAYFDLNIFLDVRWPSTTSS
jgi:hypothetical protein